MKKTMRLLITCPFGLSAILGTELKRLGMDPIDSFGTGTYIEGNQKDMMQINIWSRIANKVYLEAGRAVCLNFDQLFALVQSTDWSQYVSEGQGVVVSVVSKNSALNSERTIQSITNKAIYQQLNPAGGRKLDKDIDALEVSVMIMDDFATIWINSSGRGLYQRGYRNSTGDAPLKENLAAAIVLLSNWKFSSPLWDPCCGSGTLVIEAAMIARNVAPGLQRRFAFETWKGHDAQAFLELQKLAISKQFNDKNYQISASDLDPQMITIAQENAQKAGVADTINFFTHDLLSPLTPFDLHNMTIVSNPPYGKRLTAADLDKIYSHLVSLVSHGCGGFITSYKAVSSLVSRDWMSKRMFNGADECALWIKR